MKAVLDQATGFTHIWDLLKDHKMKFVGHNCFLDILFMFSHFDDHLGKQFNVFKDKLKTFFP